jgi:16S rRNA (guanine527-N7)-methyltransferase
VTHASGSLETDVESAAATRAIFGDRYDVAAAYADLLTTTGIERGLIGPREAERIWSRHLINSAAVAPLIPQRARVVDLGSGAGLPGIPLAIARPDLTVVLLEPMKRRATFLRECLATLPLPGVTVEEGRAEAGVAPLAEVVVARAVASLATLVRLSFPLLVDSGLLLALKGRRASGELKDMRRTMTVDAEVLELPAPGEPVTVVRVVRSVGQRGRKRASR